MDQRLTPPRSLSKSPPGNDPLRVEAVWPLGSADGPLLPENEAASPETPAGSPEDQKGAPDDQLGFPDDQTGFPEDQSASSCASSNVSAVPTAAEIQRVLQPPETSSAGPSVPAAVYTGPSPLQRFLWLACAIAGLTLLAQLLPPFVERMQYALTRGRQRAEYETATVQLPNSPLAELSKASQLVSRKVGPSVVHINLASLPAYRELSGNEPEDRAPGTPPRRRFEGQGSGVIMDAEGYIVTNRHVVVGSRDIQVKLGDGRVVPARIIGVDRLTDLAVLKIDADRLIAAEWGDSGHLEVGAMVWALGSPFGLERSITFGILSAKHRADSTGNPYQDFLQTDAAVNPGNSGGPLVDTAGRVVGINTAIVGESYQGISFAIPSRVARDVYERLRRQGRVRRGWLGVQPEAVTLEMAERLGIPQPQGALIVALADINGTSPAREAGLQVGDVVIRWNNEPINTPADLFARVGMTEIGREVEVVVIREGSERTLPVVVGERSDS